MASFLDSLFSSGSTATAGGNLLGDAGDIGLGLVQNKGKQIEGQYKVELQKLINDQTKTQAEVNAELARLNTARDAALGDVKTEQAKIYLGYGLGIVAVIGVVVALLAWIRK